MKKLPKIEVGDYIVFKAATRDSFKKARRKVKRFDGFGRPLVGYGGWSEFIVHLEEILEVEKS